MNSCRLVRAVVPPAIPLIVVVGAVEVIVRLGWVPRFLVPTPSSVFASIYHDRREFAVAVGNTGLAALIGFAMSAAGGVFLGVVLSSARWIERAFYPYAVFFQTVPIIAIAPLLVIWVGYGMPTVIASAFIVSLFPVIANTLEGLLSVDPALRDLFRLYGAGRMATLFKLRLPAALPSIMTGLRIGAGLAVIGAIVGEFIGSGGLGSLVDIAKTQQRTDKVYAAVLLASLLGLALFILINMVSRRALRHWHASEVGD